ncbi:hypothetical protein ACFP47_08560 [Nesterenkonia lacusekhoensis]
MIESSIDRLTKLAGPSAIKAMSKSDAGRRDLMRRAAFGSQDFVSRTETLVTGRKSRGQSRAAKYAQTILENVPGGEIRFALAAAEEELATAGLLERVASRTLKTAKPRDIIDLRRRAVDLDPRRAHRYVALAAALGSETQSRIVHGAAVGLHRGQETPHADEIIELLKSAQALAPSNAVIAFELGQRLLERGDAEEGLAQLEKAALKHPDEQRLMALAQAYRRPDIAQFSQALESYEHAYSLNPKNQKALGGVVHSGARGPMDWPRVWRTVHRIESKRQHSPLRTESVAEGMDSLFSSRQEVEAETVTDLLSELDECRAEGKELNPQTVGLLVLRVQFLGHFAAGFRLRTRNAERRAQRLRRSGVRDLGGLRQMMQALVYLDNAETASRLSQDVKYWAQNTGEQRMAVAKLHADAELMLGNPEPYFKYSVDARKDFYLPAERKMVNLIKKKRVAIVGPAATGESLGSEIDGYDVVVRPNFNPEFVAAHPESMGSRTDIAYYSGQDMTTLIDDVESLIENSDVQLINTRSFSYHTHHRRNLPWLRFARHDWSLSYHGSPLGIQRMIYDLLQFRPEEIAIFNSDFYTGSGEFAEGYRKKRSFAPGSFMNDLVVVHDLLTDFRFTQAMLKTGRVTAQGRAAEVLSRDPFDYLRDVEQAGVLR